MSKEEEFESYEERNKGDQDFHRLDSEEGPGPCKSIEGWLICVTGIHEEAQEDDINDTFSAYGTIKNLHLNLDRRTGYVKGYALVEYQKYEEASAAVKNMNGGDILEKRVSVDWAFKKAPKSNKRR